MSATMKADIHFKTTETGIQADLKFEGTIAEKLTFCQYILTSMDLTPTEVLKIAYVMEMMPMEKGRVSGISTSINIQEYIKQKGKEDG